MTDRPSFQPEYLGQPIDGVSSYKVRVGIFTSTAIFGWEEAKQLAFYAQNYQPAPESESTCGTELHQALETAFDQLSEPEHPSPPPSR